MPTLRLRDGRTLGYAITGDLAGPPTFYFHGWLASRLEAALIDTPPVRLIAVDRPGYGLSSPQPGRRLLDWPADVADLADYLGLDRFHVVGVSGGGPYALACAAVLDRVVAATLISPVPPLAGPHAPSSVTLGEDLRRLRWIGGHPRLGLAALTAGWIGFETGALNPQTVFNGLTASSDIACLTAAMRARLIATWREGLRRGVAGAASDARIYAGDWGFDLATVSKPVTIWHGTADGVVPPATVDAYARLVATRRMLDGEGHYSLALTRSAEIVAGLASSGRVSV